MSMTLNMSMTLSLHPSLSHESPHHRPVAFLRRRHHHRHRPLSVSASIRQDTTTWTPAPLSKVSCAGERLCYVNVDLAKSPDLVADFVTPGQYVQIRIPPALVNPPPSPAYFYIASPVGPKSEFQFLVKSVPGKTAGVLCKLKKGDVVELSGIDGSGFDMDQLLPPEAYPTVLLFTTGYGIGPIRSLIKTGFSANKRSDVRLYYGVESLKKMAYQDEFKDWEALGVDVIPVLSDPPANWNGATGHVQDVYLKSKPISKPLTTGAVLSGNPDMVKVCRFLELLAVYAL
ncbi:Fruit protein like [Actinidia chinensis var. chinensis]|uniref:Fruit protein like n=1 Tax=Actinidia chinensis var. chinensis TaxID=1590841 RepID=A0A2R6P3W2_ACTCC|nr:Fruit protein like [Actinidia chinensis var. chinensis]